MSVSEIAWREEERAKFLARDCVNRQIGRLQAWFPSRDWRDPEILRGLTALVIEVGEERMEAAIDEVLDLGGLKDDGARNTSFPPTMPEIRNCVPRPRGEFIAPRKDCPQCQGTGFCMIGEGRERRATGCACRKGVA